MARIVMVALLILIFQSSFAQRRVGVFQQLSTVAGEIPATRDYIDTVKANSFIPQNEGGLGCFTGIYAAPDSGYVTGNNKYGDRQKAQFYSLTKMGYSGPAILQAVQVFAGVKKEQVPGDLIYINIYAADTSGFRPGNLIATSNPVNLSEINDAGLGTTFTFLSPVTITDSFFVSITLPQLTGDTLAILSTTDKCSAYSGWSWEMWSDSSWHTLLNSWILDVDLAIFPIMDLPFNAGVGTISSTIKNARAFPNPTSSQFTLEYETTQAASVEILWVNEQGKIIQHNYRGMTSAGRHEENFEVEHLEPGLYHLLIISGNLNEVCSLIID